MIIDQETNFVYFSSKLLDNPKRPDYLEIYKVISEVLIRNGIGIGLLDGTKDIWCRDYMPIQTGRNDFIGFRYEPSYLNTQKWKEKRSIPTDVCRENGIIFSDHPEINIDGGNVVKWKNKVILTKRIFKENKVSRKEEKNKLVSDIENILQVKAILIQDYKQKDDPFGHADGYIRFINEDTVIVNNLDQEKPEYSSEIKKILKENNLDYKEIPWFLDDDPKNKVSAVGNYINYLEVGSLVVLPEYKGLDKYKECNERAYFVLREIFGKEKIIEQIEMTPIAKEGGVLNCISWNILK